MTTPQQEGTQTGEENSAQILSTFVHIENVNGPQYIFNCGHRSLKEMLALQEQAIKLQREQQTGSHPSNVSLLQPSFSAAAPSTSTPVPLGSQTPAARKNPPRTRRKKELAQDDILPTPHDTPEAPVESCSKEKERDPLSIC